jgi:glycosyltransferase involved in cell wall biosynthesis
MTARVMPVPTVMVVHDVRALVAPRFDSAARHLRFRLALGWACRVATHVVCVSEFTAASLDASVRVDPSRVSVIGEAPSLHLAAAPGPAPTDSPGRPYVLYVGSLLAHKNVDTLIRAFALGRAEHDLVLAGPASERERRHVVNLIDELGCEDQVRHVGWLDDLELSRLYRNAAAIAIPSLHEGFGLPVLEGMQAGVPVIASDIPAFREVTGDHATLVERPRDPLAWQDAISSLAFDETRIAAARSWAQRTTWADIAAAFVKLFGELSTVPCPP